ncbi:MAG: hypothetical protein FJ293_10270 [Planctomycetes bacterium]|nr:hypothetical protein [Planctomycetota bacterium]
MFRTLETKDSSHAVRWLPGLIVVTSAVHCGDAPRSSAAGDTMAALTAPAGAASTVAERDSKRDADCADEFSHVL